MAKYVLYALGWLCLATGLVFASMSDTKAFPWLFALLGTITLAVGFYIKAGEIMEMEKEGNRRESKDYGCSWGYERSS